MLGCQHWRFSKRMDAASVATSAERLRSGLRSLRLYTRNWADLTGSKRDALELLGWVISSCLTSVPHLRTLIFESENQTTVERTKGCAKVEVGNLCKINGPDSKNPLQRL